MTATPLGRTRPALLRFLISLSLALAVAPGAAPAQEAVPQAGDRVRVTVRDVEAGTNLRYVGNLAGWDAVSISWDSDGSAYDAPLERVAKLERSRGTKSNWLKGGGIGSAIGFALAFGTVAIVCGGDGCYDSGADLNYAFAGGALGAGAGFLVGGLIGSGSRTERWSEVSPGVYGNSSPVVARLPH